MFKSPNLTMNNKHKTTYSISLKSSICRLLRGKSFTKACYVKDP